MPSRHSPGNTGRVEPHPRTRSQLSTLAPALGLVAGAAIGIMLAALGVIGIGWGIVDGAAIGLILGAIVGAFTRGS